MDSTQSWLPGVGQWRRRVLGEQADKLEVDGMPRGMLDQTPPVWSCCAQALAWVGRQGQDASLEQDVHITDAEYNP